MSGLDTARARQLLKTNDFRGLFIEELGWDRYSVSHSVSRDALLYTFTAIAEKRGVVAFVCSSSDGTLPSYRERIALENELATLVHEHVIVFVDGSAELQVWQWVRREAGKTPATREHQFHISQSGDSLIAKLDLLLFTLDEEADVTIALVTQRARAAFDVDSVTKRFYERFQQEHLAFLEFVEGFSDQGNAEWYASLMMNRLMFVYFMQKRGFIDDDRDYLQNRFRLVKETQHVDTFHTFYRYFLVRLFHDGLATPEISRDVQLAQILGNVPYLNGGLFEPHALEIANTVDIPDQAFARLFSFFDSYNWHLDDRPLRNDNEINPDVLGYIFEKYINQKDMGAYYTKEDVTSYVAGNAISAALLNLIETNAAVARVKTVVEHSPERYIQQPDYVATSAAKDSSSLRITDASPHCSLIRAAIGQNLDLSTIMEDIIQDCSPEELWDFWTELRTIRILDPTCGSGAFLFAALRILQPLFESVVNRMEGLLGSGAISASLKNQFSEIINEQSRHANPTYYTVKTILLNNLFGVDLMEEAVEICKLRLFLHLASTLQSPKDLEPLPDLDFNVKCGNTIVGFSSRDELAHAMDSLLDVDEDHYSVLAACDRLDEIHSRFRMGQSGLHGESVTFNKAELQAALSEVRGQFDQFLTRQVGGEALSDQEAWLRAHRPFHWFAEFHEIINSGGFDVIIGNPPYSEVPKSLSRLYLRQLYPTALPSWSRDEDLYTFVVERSLNLLSQQGAFGMVLPLSISFSTKKSYSLLRRQLSQAPGSWWFSHFDRIPSALFGNDVRTRCTIALHVRERDSESPSIVGVTELLRWTQSEREQLFQTLRFAEIDSLPEIGIPKLGSPSQATFYSALTKSDRSLATDLRDVVTFTTLQACTPNFPENSVFVGGTAYNWFPVWRQIPATTDASGLASLPARTAGYRFRNEKDADGVFALLASSLGYWWWAVAGDGFNLKKWLLDRFPLSLSGLSIEARGELAAAGAALRTELLRHYVFKENKGKIGNWYLPACAAQVRTIDDVLAKHVDGLNQEVLGDLRAFNSRFSRADPVTAEE